MALQIDFEALISRSPNPYVVMDRALRLVWMNDAYLRVTMRTRESILGRIMFDAFPSVLESESHRLLEGSLKRVLETGEHDELALIRYDIARPDGGMEIRYWSATHTPLLDENGEVAYILQHTVDVTELQTLRALRDEVGLVERAHAVQTRNLNLTQESQQLKALFEQAPGFVAILSGRDHRFQLANQAYVGLVGHRQVIGKTVAEALPEVVGQGFVDLLDNVWNTATPYVGRHVKVLLRQEDGRIDERFLDFIYQPIFGGEGVLSGIFVLGHDVTEEVEAEDRQALLINELNHRVKNTLAIVQALAQQSFRGVEGARDAQRNFEARLRALAAAHSMLTAHNWEVAGLRATVQSSVEATSGMDISRFHIAGPDCILAPQMALSLAMVIHELATNAIKYGALSNGEGSIAIEWSLAHTTGKAPLMTLRWTESGGPAVDRPSRRGFGTRLIERGMAAEQDGAVAIEYRPEGLRCTIRARLGTPLS